MYASKRVFTLVIAFLAALGVLSILAAVAFGSGLAPKSAQAAALPEGPARPSAPQSSRLSPTSATNERKVAALSGSLPLAVSAMTVSPAKKPSPVPEPAAKKVRRAAPAPSGASGGKRRYSRSARVSGTGWRSARVSWYGPGFYGNTMAGGGKLQRDSMVVAHRSLPFGTKVQFLYKGRTVTAAVRDRGPYVAGREFDLGPGTARALGFSGVHTVRYRILGR